ncbi:MAG TPA: integrin alpha [Myxococcota bacterium]|nr:integrin alpha [Myxococcota bacterium]
MDDRSLQSRRLLGVSLARMGRAEVPLAEIQPGVVSSERERVEIRRAGLVEWYRNSSDGLEQGFDLETRPGGRGSLVLELAILDAAASVEDDAVVFRSETGRRLSYGRIEARDAAGKVVVARLEAPDPQRVRLVVDDSEAAYPLTIDPLLTASEDARIETNQAGANLGISVAGAGDVNGDGYDDVIVGAYKFDAGETDEGAAFVYLGSCTGISGAPASMIQSNQAGAWLGSVASAGDVNGDGYDDVIVGAQKYADGEIAEGAAFVFLGSRHGIVARGDPTNADATLESNQANAYFGGSVASAGDVNGDGYDDVIVGANGYEDRVSETDEGAAFIFLGSRHGIVAHGDPTTADTRLETNQLGGNLTAVASAGDVNGDGYDDVIVGANAYDAPDTNEGAAFVFLGSRGGIADGNPMTADARFESNQARSFFGSSVASGDFNGDGYSDVAIGGGNYDAPDANEGAVFVFLGSRAGLRDGNPATADAVFQSDQPGAFFASVAAGDFGGDASDDLIIGAHTYDDGELNEGAAFLFLGSRHGLASGNPATAAARLEVNQQGADFGAAVASAGDVNGDGSDDVIVGAGNYDDGELNEGAAFVYLGEHRHACHGTRPPHHRHGHRVPHERDGVREP